MLMHTLNADRKNLDPLGAGGVPLGATRSLLTATASFTRPNNTTAYSDKGLVANDTVAGNVVPLAFDLSGIVPPGGAVQALWVRIRFPGQTASGSVVLNLYNAPPVPTVGDGGTFTVATTPGEASLQASFTISTSTLTSDGNIQGSTTPLTTLLCLAPGSSKLYGLLSASGPWTPSVAAQTITVELVVQP